MANYNTFLVVENRKPILVSSSIRKCIPLLRTGARIEVWNDNRIVKKIYTRNRADLKEYVALEKEYIRKKQERRTNENRKHSR